MIGQTMSPHKCPVRGFRQEIRPDAWELVLISDDYQSLGSIHDWERCHHADLRGFIDDDVVEQTLLQGEESAYVIQRHDPTTKGPDNGRICDRAPQRFQ